MLIPSLNNVLAKRSLRLNRNYLNHLCIFQIQGDSGGPLVCNGEQYGIVSWSIPCAVGVPDVYTNVYYYLDFIESS